MLNNNQTRFIKVGHLPKDQRVNILKDAIENTNLFSLDYFPRDKFEKEPVEGHTKKDVVQIYEHINEFDHFVITVTKSRSEWRIKYRVGNPEEGDFYGYVYLDNQNTINDLKEKYKLK